MLRALAATGVLTEARAILYGRPYGEESSFEAYDRVLLQVLDESGLRLFLLSRAWTSATPIRSSFCHSE